jgi:bifunctional UDP-N-acetylglucosamine pyrophosphorylase/glucosamine-1-phosphate N-acetyltransferase
MNIPNFQDRKTRLDKILELETQGVVFIDKERTYIESNVTVGKGTIIYPDVYLFDGTTVGEETEILPFTIIKNSRIGSHCHIGPSAYIRDQSAIEDWCEIGITEIARSRIGEHTKAKHGRYIGDGEIGEHCNIGAGTVFCNYDGVKKHKIVLGNHVFIGSGTMLVAPLTMSDWSATGANTTLPKRTYEGYMIYYVKDGKLISRPNPLAPSDPAKADKKE